MLKVVAHHYLGQRSLYDPVTKDWYEGTLLNLQINLDKFLKNTENAHDYTKLRRELEHALTSAIAPSDFNKKAIVQAFGDNAKAWNSPPSDQPLIFHP